MGGVRVPAVREIDGRVEAEAPSRGRLRPEGVFPLPEGTGSARTERNLDPIALRRQTQIGF